MSPMLNWPMFNNTAYSTLLPNKIDINISGYTIAIVAIHSMVIAAASHNYVIIIHIPTAI